MKMKLKKGMANFAKHGKKVEARVSAMLDRVSNKSSAVTVGRVHSDNSDAEYEIKVGSGNALFCTCKGWQYSKTGSCKHLERWKAALVMTPLVVGRLK